MFTVTVRIRAEERANNVFLSSCCSQARRHKGTGEFYQHVGPGARRYAIKRTTFLKKAEFHFDSEDEKGVRAGGVALPPPPHVYL